MGVRATVREETKSVNLATNQDDYTFKFDIDVAPGDFMERHLALVIGLGLIVVAIVLAFVFGTPTPLQAQIIRGTFSLAGGAVATEISGMIKVDLTFGQKVVIAATGALAVFLVLFFFVPAG